MKSLKYIWRNIVRNKVRSLLTILSVGFSLALMTVLYGFMEEQSAWSKDAKLNNRIVVMSTQGFSGKLPIANVDKVRNTPNVVAAVPYAWYGGTYEDKQMPFAQFATDPNYVFDVWPELTIPADQLEAFQKNRRGCVCDRRIAEKYKWNIGDRVPLKGTFYPFDLDLELVGMFDAPKNTDSLWFNWQYLDEGLQQQNFDETGNSGTIFAKIDSSAAIPATIEAIDDRFESSENPTRTQTEAAFAQMFIDMLGNIQDYIRNIGLAVVFSLSLVAANAMAMSMRERVTEIAVLKAIGFSRSRILFMILGESCVIALFGGILGVTMGCAFLEMMHKALPQQFPFSVFEIPGPWILWGFVVAAGIGIASGLVPAIRASRLSVIDGLRRIA